MSRIIIVAPHGDDEIIGCFELLAQKPIILYDSECMDSNRKEEIQNLKKYYEVEQWFSNQFIEEFEKDEFTVYIPDPVYEIHPRHKFWGQVGEQLARSGKDIIFYTTNMNTPYLHECKDPVGKKELLNLVYPSQEDLWKYEHKYFLFEGRCKWIF
jgi:hypothetical protein